MIREFAKDLLSPVIYRSLKSASNHINDCSGILTNRDVRFADKKDQPVYELMTNDLITIRENVSIDEPKRLLHQHRIEKLLVVDGDYHCTGLVTVKDIGQARQHPDAAKDEQLLAAGVDIVVVDTAHGQSRNVLDAVNRLIN